jgi:hypothetical protein
MEIEVNALRAGGKTIVTSPNDTTKVTSKARILKGTALSGTTIDTTLTMEAITDRCVDKEPGDPSDCSVSGRLVDVVIGSDVAPNPITLGVGKGGKGASLLLSTEECGPSGYLTFTAEFRGEDVDGETCVGSRELRKACR